MKSLSVLPDATVSSNTATRWYRWPFSSVTVPMSLKPVASGPRPLSLSVGTSVGCTGEVGHLKEIAREVRNLSSQDVYVHSSLQHFAGPIGSGEDELLIRVAPVNQEVPLDATNGRSRARVRPRYW